MTTPTHGNESGKATYDASYYASHCGSIPYSRDQVALMNHFRTLAATIVERYAPKRVLDVGCAKGLLVEHLRDLGVEAFGIDTSEYALSEVRADIKPFCKFAAATERLDGRYDLLTCIEVAEHLPEEQAEALIANLCAHADDILFSSTPLDYAEDTHFNVQPREYWIDLFARNGFYPDLRFEPHAITPQALRFKKLTRPIQVVICSKEKAEWAVVRLRILDPLRELEKNGRAVVTYVSAYDTDLPIEKLIAADVFVVQREFAEAATSAPFIAAARQLGKVVVFEIDDLLTKTPRSNPVYPYSMRIAGDLIRVAREADFITTSTAPLLDELAEEIPDAHQKGHVLRNVVNTEIWGDTFEPRLPAENEPYVVGWFGSPTHDEDLAIVKDAITYLARKHPGEVEFHFFGYLPKDLRDIPGVKLVRGSQPNVVKHAAGVRAARIDLAIAPLADNAFNRSKSDLKWLEYSICGIPAIFSDVTPYREAITPGVDGWIVKNDTASWVAAIERLLRDDEARLNLARNAFQNVRTNYCLDVAAQRWDSLYRSFVISGPRDKVEAPDDAAVSKAVARVLVAQARFQAARGATDKLAATLESILKFDATAAQEVLPLAVALAHRGMAAASIKALAAITNRADGAVAARAWRNLADLHLELHDPIALEHTLEISANAAPDDPDLALQHIDWLRATRRDGVVAKRLEAMTQRKYAANEAVVVADALVAAGRPKEALSIVRAASSRHPDADFAPLVIALTRAQSVPENALGQWTPSRHRHRDRLLRVAVFTREPVAGPRVRSRLAAPLAVLDAAAAIGTQWSNGQSRIEIADDADVVVFQRSIIAWEGFARVHEYARRRGKKIAYEIDDVLFPGAESALTRWLPEMDAIFVATRQLRDLLAGLAPAAAKAIQVLATGLDIDLPRTRVVAKKKTKPHIAIITGYATPHDIRPLVKAIGNQLEERIGKFAVSNWAALPGDVTLSASGSSGCQSPLYADFTRQLVTQQIDVALVPVSNDSRHTALSDRIWLDLAAARIPGLYSARDPFASTILAGSTGFLLGDDPSAWVAAIQQLLENPRLGKDIADRAHVVAHAERTIPQLAKKFGRALHDLAHGTNVATHAEEKVGA